ncbi:hypothetical protein [Streptomyces sp. NPDC094437]|uniref:hypothetical protein n=1 Tax=Streptomyces sp. NPDC094437 TaxID=3366060 RepID=UPI00381B16E6
MSTFQGALRHVCSMPKRCMKVDVDPATKTAYVLSVEGPEGFADSSAQLLAGASPEDTYVVAVSLTGEPDPTIVLDAGDKLDGAYQLALDGRGNAFSGLLTEDGMVRATFASKSVTKVNCPVRQPYSVALSATRDALFTMERTTGRLYKLTLTGEGMLDDTFPAIGAAKNWYDGLRVDGSAAYTVKDLAEIWRVDLTGHTVSAVPWKASSTRLAAVQPSGAGTLFVLDQTTLWELDLSSGKPTKLADVPGGHAEDLVLDGADLYIVTFDREMYGYGVGAGRASG